MFISRWTVTAVFIAAGAFAGNATAADCEVAIQTGDNLQFGQTVVTVDPRCKEFKVVLKHTGKLAKNVMGHNWVLSKAADVNGVAMDGMQAGLDKNYLKLNDPRVIAHTKVIGGGEETSVSFSTDKLNAQEEYIYFCSFPGHFSVMRGTLALRKE